MGFTRSDELLIEDGKVKKPGDAGSTARPMGKGNPQVVGLMARQKAPLVHENEQSVGEGKVAKGKKGKASPLKKAIESQNKRKQAQEVGRPAPKAVKRGK